jgi:hypothetical protein
MQVYAAFLDDNPLLPKNTQKTVVWKPLLPHQDKAYKLLKEALDLERDYHNKNVPLSKQKPYPLVEMGPKRLFENSEYSRFITVKAGVHSKHSYKFYDYIFNDQAGRYMQLGDTLFHPIKELPEALPPVLTYNLPPTPTDYKDFVEEPFRLTQPWGGGGMAAAKPAVKSDFQIASDALQQCGEKYCRTEKVRRREDANYSKARERACGRPTSHLIRNKTKAIKAYYAYQACTFPFSATSKAGIAHKKKNAENDRCIKRHCKKQTRKVNAVLDRPGWPGS